MLSLFGCAMLIGLLVGQMHRLQPPELGLAAAAAALGAVLTRAHPPWRLASVACCAAALGALRGALAAPPERPLGADLLWPLVGQAISVRGSVSGPPVVSTRSVRVLLQLQAVVAPGQASAAPELPSATRLALVDRPDGPLAGVSPGDVVEAEGTLVAAVGRAPPTLAFPNRIAIQAAPAADPLEAMREGARRAISQALPAPQAALAADVLLGGSGGLDSQLRLQLQRSGLAHLVAIDGFKQALLAAGVRALAVPLLGGRRAGVAVLPAVLGYTLLSGARPSAVRASVMLGLAELARLSGRMPDPLTALVLAVTLMALLDPRALFDVGLQLSASATLGIILLWPTLRRALRGLPRVVAEPAGLTLAVSVATLPVNLSVFQQVSLVSPLAHVVAMPLVPLVMCGAALLAAVGSLVPDGGFLSLVADVVWVPVSLLAGVVRLFGGLPGAAVSTGALAPGAAVGLGCATLAFAGWLQPDAAALRQRTQRYHAPFALATAGLGAVWFLLLVQPDGQLHVQALETGSGAAVFIRAPTGRTTLVTAGRIDGYTLLVDVEAALPVWEHGFDTLVVLDPASESGLSMLLERYPARQIVETDALLDLGGGATLIAHPALGIATLSFGERALAIPGEVSGEP